MILPRSVLLVLVLGIGFLVSSNIYFYQKLRQSSVTRVDATNKFSAEIPQLTASQSTQKIDELTKPASPKGRVSYPKNVYTVGSNETLFGIGTKFSLDWKLIKLANATSNEDLIQAGFTLVIPRIDSSTDYYRINFIIDEEKVTELNRELRDRDSDPNFNPIEVAKKDVAPYFGLTAGDEYSLLEVDESGGTALVGAKNSDTSVVVGLYQPKVKGNKGFWATLYIELRDK